MIYSWSRAGGRICGDAALCARDAAVFLITVFNDDKPKHAPLKRLGFKNPPNKSSEKHSLRKPELLMRTT